MQDKDSDKIIRQLTLHTIELNVQRHMMMNWIEEELRTSNTPGYSGRYIVDARMLTYTWNSNKPNCISIILDYESIK